MIFQTVSIPSITPEQQKMIDVTKAGALEIQRYQFSQLIVIFTLFVVISFFIIWLAALINVLFKDFKKSTDKVVWLLAVILIPITAPIYFIWLRKQKNKNRT